MLTLLATALLTAGPFPLPSIDGKPLATTPEQKRFRLPMRFEKVRAFYESQFTAQEEGLTRSLKTVPVRTLTFTSKRAGDTWTRATITEGETETVVVVTPVLRLDDQLVEGNGKPLVQFVIGRSGDVDRAVQAIGDKHVEQIRR